jgi:hypothetical protein
MGRKRNIALLVIAGMVGLAAIAWAMRPRDEPAKATVEDAVRSFRAEKAPGSQDERREGPAPGVYRYATRGLESAQAVFAGATHDYDGVSTITLSPGRCGTRERWQVLDGRWSEIEACDDSVWVTEFHEFFGVGQKDSFRCHGGSRSETLVLEPGARFSTSCEGEETSTSSDWRVIAFERVPVGGESFDAIHLESRSAFEGESSGTARREEWRRRADGLLLRLSSQSDADSSAGGGTHYSERYTLRLLDVTPRR